MKRNGCLRVQFEESKETVIELPEEMCYLNDKEFCLRDCILNHSACAAYDGSKKDHSFGGHCVITDAKRTKLLRRICRSNRWELNNVKTAEGHLWMILLEAIHKMFPWTENTLLMAYFKIKLNLLNAPKILVQSSVGVIN